MGRGARSFARPGDVANNESNQEMEWNHDFYGPDSSLGQKSEAKKTEAPKDSQQAEKPATLDMTIEGNPISIAQQHSSSNTMRIDGIDISLPDLPGVGSDDM